MDLFLAGKLALVTGASKGIGRAIARMLAQEGSDLIMVGRDEASLRREAEQIEATTGVAVRSIAADLSQMSAIARLADEIGELDILINNAGAIPMGSLLQVDDDTWANGWDLKVHGYVRLCRSLYPALRERRGVIVNIIGAAGEYLDPDYLAGSTGNAALMAFTKAFARGARTDGIRVVGINPGPVATQRYEKWIRRRAADELGDEDRWPELTQGEPFGRAAKPEEIASAVCFLASERSAYTTGTVLTIDGAAA